MSSFMELIKQLATLEKTGASKEEIEKLSSYIDSKLCQQVRSTVGDKGTTDLLQQNNSAENI